MNRKEIQHVSLNLKRNKHFISAPPRGSHTFFATVKVSNVANESANKCFGPLSWKISL